MNYDLNLLSSGALQKIELTFGDKEKRRRITVEIGGNCSGLDVIESAVTQAADELDEDEYLLREELVKAEILSFIPNKPI